MKNVNVKKVDCHAALVMTKNMQSGRSMIEMLGVLAIIGILSVGGIAGYSKAMQKYRINKAIEQITLIAGNVRSFFAPQRSYKDLCNTVARKANLVPEETWEYYDSDQPWGAKAGDFKQFTNVFGENVGLDYTHKAKQGDKQAFYIGYVIPRSDEVCIELVSHDWTYAGVKAIKIGGPGAQQGISLNKTPVSVDDAVAKCSDRLKGVYGNLQLIFYFDVNDNCLSLPDHGDILNCS